MDKPTRIQRKRTKGWRMPKNTVYVGRGSKWGNPHKVGDLHPFDRVPITPKEAVILFEYFWTRPVRWQEETKKLTEKLRGKNLACWCPLDRPCHADFLLKLANSDG